MSRHPSIQSAAMVLPTFQPLAVTLDQAAELLGKSLEEIEAAAQVEPYTHHGGSPRWSLFELRIALGEPARRRADQNRDVVMMTDEVRAQLKDLQEKLDLTRKLIRMEELDPGGPEFIAHLDQQEARLKERIRTLRSQLGEQQEE